MLFRFIPSKHFKSTNLSYFKRFIFSTNRLLNNGGDGPLQDRSTVTILNKDLTQLMINSFSTIGFRLNNGISIIGPIVIFPKTVLSWNIVDVDSINLDSVELLRCIEPKLDLIIIGVDEEPGVVYKSGWRTQLLKKIKDIDIRLEVLSTHQACTTFNFLNAENRWIAALLTPPKQIKYNENDLYSNTNKYKAVLQHK